MGEDVATVREQILSAIVEDETGPRGVLPLANDMRKLWVLAHDVAKSDLVPKEMVNNPANVYLAMLQAYELRLNPALAMQNIYVVNKRTAVFGDLFLALIQRSLKYEWHKEYFEGEEGKDDFMAVCEIKRVGIDTPFQATFSIADAKKAKLIPAHPDAPWSKYPKRMLKMRARSWAGRDGFADELRGVGMVEEIRDYAVKNITPEPESLPVGRLRLLNRQKKAEEEQFAQAVKEEEEERITDQAERSMPEQEKEPVAVAAEKPKPGRKPREPKEKEAPEELF